MKKYNFDHLSKKEKEVMWAKIKPILDRGRGTKFKRDL